MTPEQHAHIRARLAMMAANGINHAWLTWATELADEVDRLNLELIEARLEAEEAWDAYDKAIEREKRRDTQRDRV